MLFYEVFLTFFFALFLSILASFFSVVIYRTATGKSFVKGRSKCDSCGKQIAWYDNLPLLSFIFLGGKCRHCHKKIPSFYFFTELIAFLLGLSFCWFYLHSGLIPDLPIWQLVGYFLFLLVLLFAVLADLKYLIVPDFFVGLLLVLAISLQILSKQSWLEPLLAVAFSTLFFSSLYLFAKKILGKEALGLGDIKLMVPIALLLSWPNIILGIFLAFIVGGVFAMLVLLTGRKKFGQVLPFAPFLVLGALLTFVWGESIWQWYLGLLF
jgi:leader peptidase (prepilin peptidase)/N-methyltransferase